MPDSISSQDLNTLIEGLEECQANGVVDPWLLSNGTVIQPLDLLRELRALRQRVAELEQKRDEVLGIIAGIVWSPEGVKVGKPFTALRVLVPDPDATIPESVALRARKPPGRRAAICNNDGYELEVPTGSLAIDPCPQCGELQWRFEPPGRGREE